MKNPKKLAHSKNDTERKIAGMKEKSAMKHVLKPMKARGKKK